jgi:hypothetical protein
LGWRDTALWQRGRVNGATLLAIAFPILLELIWIYACRLNLCPLDEDGPFVSDRISPYIVGLLTEPLRAPRSVAEILVCPIEHEHLTI